MFIQVSPTSDSEPMLLNVNSILRITTSHDGVKIETTQRSFKVREDFDDIKRLLKQAKILSELLVVPPVDD